jgi:NAD(P)-dependent dehydrogenase (short-subunit alcohol dehydrogenase family)
MRDGVLAGVRVAAAQGPCAARAEELGATIVRAGEPAEVLVWEGAGGIRDVLDGAWAAIRAVAVPFMIPAEDGLIVLVAPRPDDAAAEAARAGLENLARTLSIEWARFGVRPVAIWPGTGTSPAEVAELVAFLASPAGAYYSGCRFELGSV